MKKDPNYMSSRTESRQLARRNRRAHGKAIMAVEQRAKKQRLYEKKKAARKLARKQRKAS